MRTDTKPYSVPPPGIGAPNIAHTGNFFQDDKTVNTFDNGYAVTGSGYAAAQNYLSDVGAYSSAGSYYGTFDQGGDLSSWDEALVTGSRRGFRGGSWVGGEGSMRATDRESAPPSFGDVAYGFRMALVSQPGDFNGDAKVDAADYVVWRKGLGTTYTQSDYNVWRANFGQSAGSGAGASATAAVPEPATLLQMILVLAVVLTRRRRYAYRVSKLINT